MSLLNHLSEIHSVINAHSVNVTQLIAFLQDVIALAEKWLPVVRAGGQIPPALTEMVNLAHSHDTRAGLPPGTFLKILQTLLPILGQLLPVLFGGAAAA